MGRQQQLDCQPIVKVKLNLGCRDEIIPCGQYARPWLMPLTTDHLIVN